MELKQSSEPPNNEMCSSLADQTSDTAGVATEIAQAANTQHHEGNTPKQQHHEGKLTVTQPS
jgi:hypothetical protein